MEAEQLLLPSVTKDLLTIVDSAIVGPSQGKHPFPRDSRYLVRH